MSFFSFISPLSFVILDNLIPLSFLLLFFASDILKGCLELLTVIVYNNLAWINTNLISVIYKNFALVYFHFSPSTSYCYCLTKYIFIHSVKISTDIIIAFCSYLLFQIGEKVINKDYIYIIFFTSIVTFSSVLYLFI